MTVSEVIKLLQTVPGEYLFADDGYEELDVYLEYIEDESDCENGTPCAAFSMVPV